MKQVFADRYNSWAALRSPPHITLQPPFEWETEVAALTQSLAEFASQQAPIAVNLSGFGAFVPRVVYVNVEKTPALLAVQAALTAYMETRWRIVDLRSKTRPFAPHMTVGFRDLTKSNFKLAWAEFQHRSLTFEFVAAHLTLLRHDGKRWQTYAAFNFSQAT